MAEKPRAIIQRNLWDDNQVLRAILGICSALAVTNTMNNSLVMGLGVTFVTGLSSFTLSIMRDAIPRRIRMLVQTLVIAAYVIFVDLVLQAFLPDISRQLGPYVGLIITNCIIMGRAEAFAQQNPPVPALLDGFFAGAGYALVLLAISLIREALGFGTIFGVHVNFIGMTPWTIMIMPPAAFFIIGSFIWAMSARAARRAADKK
ncbi:MAG TPA: NADH:ubiquinone reductase (Na(+)-transporting) subunit D [Candidatus Limnocylindria bacterium]|nr:NADH:ubiquinone reductase (Na(+)-transporting) subunit D [Candidatus Limnocylindria bacterium]